MSWMEVRAIAPLIDECAQLLKPQSEKRKIELILTREADAAALIDEQYLRQILMNLLLNAIEASQRKTEVHLSVNSLDKSVSVWVRDDGAGLTLDQREHLFEPFYTTKASGHGLGLAVSRELAHSMGADLIYEPRSESGATFCLRLKGTNAE
jgi:signal transduction histidine kinase